MSGKCVVFNDVDVKAEIDTGFNHGVFIRVIELDEPFDDNVTPTIQLDAKQVKAVRKQLKQWLIENGHKEEK